MDKKKAKRTRAPTNSSTLCYYDIKDRYWESNLAEHGADLKSKDGATDESNMMWMTMTAVRRLKEQNVHAGFEDIKKSIMENYPKHKLARRAAGNNTLPFILKRLIDGDELSETRIYVRRLDHYFKTNESVRRRPRAKGVSKKRGRK